jgi:hypothetical protein
MLRIADQSYPIDLLPCWIRLAITSSSLIRVHEWYTPPCSRPESTSSPRTRSILGTARVVFAFVFTGEEGGELFDPLLLETRPGTSWPSPRPPWHPCRRSTCSVYDTLTETIIQAMVAAFEYKTVTTACAVRQSIGDQGQ